MIVLDASALLALINREPGWDVVARAAAGEDATISAVNYSEVLQKSARVGIPAEVIDGALDELTLTVSSFGRLDARLAASFYRHRSNLSLADRVCLALARSLSSPVYTTDREWGGLGRRPRRHRGRHPLTHRAGHQRRRHPGQPRNPAAAWAGLERRRHFLTSGTGEELERNWRRRSTVEPGTQAAITGPVRRPQIRSFSPG